MERQYGQEINEEMNSLFGDLFSAFSQAYEEAVGILRDPEDVEWLKVLVEHDKELGKIYEAGKRKDVQSLGQAGNSVYLAAFLLGWMETEQDRQKETGASG